MRLFDSSLRLNGFKIHKARQHLVEIQNLSDAEFASYIEEKKKAIVTHHLQNNSLYKEFLNTTDGDDWQSLPILTKKDFQQPLENRLSQGFNTANCYINKTSGSSGHPFIFAKDKWCHALTWAEIIDRFSWYNIDFNTSKQARFYGIPLDKKGYYKERLKDFFSNRFRFSIFNLSDATFETVLKKFETTSFEFINGYTSAIVQFAKFLKRKSIILHDVCPSLGICIVTAEMLFDQDKALLEYQFGVPVVNEYGASELGLIAFQNTDTTWQLNSETLFVEIIDEANNVLPNGQEGRIVITALYNKAHPFIRYEIGDMGVLSTHSTLRKPILEKLTGRTNDIAILPSGKKAAGLTFYYVTKSVIEDGGNVSEFIIEQESVGHFNIKYIAKEELTQNKKTLILSEMKLYLEPGITVSFERVTVLHRNPAGKLKQFISKL